MIGAHRHHTAYGARETVSSLNINLVCVFAASQPGSDVCRLPNSSRHAGRDVSGVQVSHVEPRHIKVPTNEPLVGPDILNTLLVKSCNYIGALGVALTVIGCLGLALGFLGVYDLQIFAFGLSAGVRIVGSVAIAGCLLSAISYGILDFVDH